MVSEKGVSLTASFSFSTDHTNKLHTGKGCNPAFNGDGCECRPSCVSVRRLTHEVDSTLIIHSLCEGIARCRKAHIFCTLIALILSNQLRTGICLRWSTETLIVFLDGSLCGKAPTYTSCKPIYQSDNDKSQGITVAEFYLFSVFLKTVECTLSRPTSRPAINEPTIDSRRATHTAEYWLYPDQSQQYLALHHLLADFVQSDEYVEALSKIVTWWHWADNFFAHFLLTFIQPLQLS